MSRTTQEILASHYRAFRQGPEVIAADYAEDAVLMAPDGMHKGRAAIQAFFVEELAGFPEGFWHALKTLRLDIDGDYAYFLWEAKPWFDSAADCFAMRDGLIAFQSTSVNIRKA